MKRREEEELNRNFEVEWYEKRPKTVLYTTKATLDTVAGSPIYVLRGKRVVRAKVSVSGAPSGADLAADILVGGNSIFSTLDSKLSVINGNTDGEVMYLMGGRSIAEDDKVQCKITTVSSATGPAVFEIEYLD